VLVSEESIAAPDGRSAIDNLRVLVFREKAQRDQYLVNDARSYDVSADGRFLLIKNPVTNTTSTTSLVVVEHWTQELEQRVPVK
jgi:hypothetical protein